MSMTGIKIPKDKPFGGRKAPKDSLMYKRGFIIGGRGFNRPREGKQENEKGED